MNTCRRLLVVGTLLLWSAARLAAAPTINTQPSTANITIGVGTSFTVAATTSGGTLTYQWQGSLDNGNTWSPIGNSPPFNNVTTATLGVNAPAKQYSGAQVRCAVTDTNGTTITSAASLNISSPAPLLVLAQPVNKSAFQGDVVPTDFKVLATGTSLTYQWYISTFSSGSYGSFTALSDSSTYSGSTTNTLSITDPYANLGGATVSNPNHYRCVVTSGGYSITTRFASLNIYATPPANITSITTKVNGSAASTIVSNDPSTITVQVNGVSSGNAVRIDRYLDLNGNGQIDFGEPLVQSMSVVDGNGAGSIGTYGSVTDPNIPKDDDLTADGSVSVGFTLTTAPDLAKGAGAYIFRVSSQAGLFKTTDSSVFTITQPALAHTVSGTVTDGTNPLPYAQVALLVPGNNGPSVTNETVADINGAFTLQAASGQYVVLALAKGYVTNFDSSPMADTTSANVSGLTVPLTPAEYVNTVTTQDIATGNPLRGVQIIFQSNSSNNISMGNTDANGVAIGGAVSEPDWSMDMSSESLGALAYLRPQSNNGIPLNTLVYVQPLRAANALIYGTLKDNSNNPLAGVSINANDGGNQFNADTLTDSTGHYYMPVYGTGGSWNVQPDNQDPFFSPSNNPVYLAPAGQFFSSVAGGSATVANFVANVSTATLSGTVTNADNSNSPISGAQMNLQVVNGQNTSFAGQVNTDGSGNFSFGVSAGSWQIQMDSNYASSNNYVTPLLSFPTVTDGNNVTGIAYAVKNGTGTISGSVIDFGGAGLSNANVTATATISGVTYWVNAQTNGSGAFSLPVIDGTWTVTAFTNNGLFFPPHNNVVVSGSVSGQVFQSNVFTSNPGNKSVNAGGSTNFNVSTQVPASPTFTWQVCTDGGGVNFSDLANGAPYSGVTTNNLNISSATIGLNGYEYRLKAVFTYNAVQYTRFSNFGTLTVTGSAPGFGLNPNPTTVTAHSGANFNVNVTGSPTPAVSWQVSTDSGTNWTTVTDGPAGGNGANYVGSNTTTLTISNTDFSLNGNLYRAVAANNGVGGPMNSTSASLTVNRILQTINNFSGASVSQGQQVNFSPSATSGLTAFNFLVTGTPTASYTPNPLTGNNITLTSPGSVTVQATQPGDLYYAPVSQNATFTVSQTPVTVSFSNLTQTYDGTSKSVGVLTTPGGVANSVTYNGSATLPINAGSYTVVVTITDSNYVLSGSGSNTLVINQANQSIFFNPPGSMSYTPSAIPLTATATSGLGVTFSVQGGPANVTGNQLTLTGPGLVTVRASQGGNGNYNPAPPQDRTISVSKGPATVSLSGLSAAYDGSPKSVTAATNPNGLTVNVTYNGSGTAPSLAGTYAVVATVSDVNYQGTAKNFLVISPAPAPGVEAVDASFTRPQFRRLSVPERLVADQVTGSGKIYAAFDNGNTVTGVNNQRIGAVIRMNANGSLDSSFNVGSYLTDAWAIVPLANGQVLVGGMASNETPESGVPNFRVFRFNNDGSPDYSYNSPVFAGMPRFMTLQLDGRLLVAPSNTFAPNGGITTLARLNADGTLDGSFTSPVLLDVINSAPGFIFANMVVDPSGKIYIGGVFGSVNGTPCLDVARLNTNGSLDTTFDPVSHGAFTTNGGIQVRGLGLQTQGANAGKLLVAGKPLITSGVPHTVIRLNNDGSLDNSFTLLPVGTGSGGVVGPNGVRPRMLNMLANDQFQIVTDNVTRFTANGAIDGTYARPVFSLEAFWMDTLADGSVLVPLEYPSTINASPVSPGPVRFTASGALDGTFTPGAFQTEVYPGNFAVKPDGRILVWGNFDTVNTTPRHGMALLNTDGSLDSFNLSGVANLYSIRDAKLLPSGQILAATLLGTYQNSNATSLTGSVSRFNSDGSVDSSFTIDGSANLGGLHALDNGTILTWNIGPDTLLQGGGGLFFERLTANGAVDNTFTGLGSTVFGKVYRGASSPFFVTSIVQGHFEIGGHYPDGRMIAFATVPNDTYPAGASSLNVTVLRLNADGTIDNTFTGPVVSWGTTSGFTDPLVDPQNTGLGAQQYQLVTLNGMPFSNAIPQADGSVIITGAFTTLGGHATPGIARLTNTGAFDTGFNVGTGPQLASGRVAGVEGIDIAPDGKYWLTGLFDTFNGSPAPGVARLNADGSTDTTLTAGIAYRSYLGNGGTKTAFGPSGEVVLAGTFGQAFEPFPFGITRLVGTVPPAITVQPQSQSTTAGSNVTFSVGVTSGLTVAYQWFFNGVAITGATKSTLTLTNVQNANAGNYTVTVTNAVNYATSNIAALTLGPSFASWQATNFTSDEILNHPELSGANAVYGQDHLPNLVKYALGLNPKVNAITGLPVPGTSGPNWTYTYTRPSNINDVTYTVEFSTDLVGWSSAGVTLTLQSSSGGIDTWQATYPLASASKIFFRLNVTQ